jgi:hypothetical protein
MLVLKDMPMAAATYTLTVGEEQARVLNAALELYSRVGMGQLGFILEHPEVQKRMSGLRETALECEDALDDVKKAIFGMASGQYHSIASGELAEETRSAWDLQQVIRHRLAWDRAGNPPLRDFATMCAVHFDQPTQSSGHALAVIAKKDEA